MFTGLIQQVGTLVRREAADGGLRLVIRGCASWNPPLSPGESIAVNGACLTAAQVEGPTFACDLLEETGVRTTLDAQPPGARLHLERALRLGDPLGGHWVTGHVDGLGTVAESAPRGRDRILRIACAPALLRGMVLKGSIAVDGVSLTIAELTDNGFTVHLVPFTCAHTALGTLAAGMAVNLETDLIGKHVARCLETAAAPAPAPLTWDRLRTAGFGSGLPYPGQPAG